MKSLRVNNKLRKFGIELITSEKPEFDSAVREYFGEDAEILSFIESTKPFPLFLKNLSSAHIIAISLSWILTARNNEKRISPQGETNFGFIHSRKPVPSERIKSYSVIPSQDLKFYSYINLPFDLVKKSKAYENSTGAGTYFSMTDQKEMLFKNFTDFAFSVEGVLFSDGRFVGEDSNFLFESITGTLKAERDFAKKIKELKDKGVSYSEIVRKAQAKSDNHSHSAFKPPRNARECFDTRYSQTIKMMRETMFRQKSQTQLSDEQIVNSGMSYFVETDFNIHRVAI